MMMTTAPSSIRKRWWMLPPLLLLCMATTLMLPFHADPKQRGDPPSALNALKLMFGGITTKPKTPTTSPQPLLVIGVGLPRTGTSSFVAALHELGLKSYHMKDGVMETPGHLQLWHDYHVSQTKTWDDVLQALSISGFNATADAPMCFMFLEQLERYPNAKVVLTVRGDGDGQAWSKSFTAAILRLMSIVGDIPFRWASIPTMLREWYPFMSRRLLGPNAPQLTWEEIFDLQQSSKLRESLPTAYEGWNEYVKSQVPPERLLIHAAQDGWKPLCEFLSDLSPDVSQRCIDIVESGKAYPNANDKHKLQALYVVFKGLSYACTHGMPLLVGALLLSMMFRGGSSRGSNIEKSKPQ